MTRDEAVVVCKTVWDSHRSDEHVLVDRLVALGVLKLDKPKSVEMRTADALVGLRIASTSSQHFGAPIGMSDVSAMEGALHAAGLKIVEA